METWKHVYGSKQFHIAVMVLTVFLLSAFALRFVLWMYNVHPHGNLPINL